MRCAVVATDRGTTRDVLGDTIPYAPPDDPAALRAAITAATGARFGRMRIAMDAASPASAALRVDVPSAP